MSMYQELAARIGLGESKIAPRLFEMLADEKDCDILLAMPATVAELRNKTGIEKEELEKRVQDLFRKGLVFPSHRTSPPTYRMGRDFVQFHDATILWPEAPREFLDLWQELMEKEWPDMAVRASRTAAKPFTRVIPVNISVKARTHILDFESVAEIVTKARRLAVTKCTCRLTAGKCDRPLEACIQVNNAAEYSIARGTGRVISVHEALDILGRAEEAGLIHVTMNKHDVEHFICNCCPCCCQTMPILIKGGIRVVDPSRYRAEIDAEICTGCGICHERCHFSALDWSKEPGSPTLVDPDKCMGCGLCKVSCPEGAIELVEARPVTFVP